MTWFRFCLLKEMQVIWPLISNRTTSGRGMYQVVKEINCSCSPLSNMTKQSYPVLKRQFWIVLMSRLWLDFSEQALCFHCQYNLGAHQGFLQPGPFATCHS